MKTVIWGLAPWLMGPVPWLTWLILCLWRWHPIGCQVLVPVAPLPVQLSAVAQEGYGDGPRAWAPAPTWETRRKHLAPGFGSAQCAGRSGHWRVNQRKEDLSLSLSLSLSLTV